MMFTYFLLAQLLVHLCINLFKLLITQLTFFQVFPILVWLPRGLFLYD
jgi:hypothetical protein